MAMRTASTGQFSVRALLVAGLFVGLPVVASAQNANVPPTHTVRKGDTLWDLAKTYFGDPLTWPQIYKMNTSIIADPHWIYPDQVLQLSGTGASVIPAEPAQAAPAPVAVAPGLVEVAPAAAAPPAEAAPPAVAVEPEVYTEAPAQTPSAGPRSAGPLPGDPTALFGHTNPQASADSNLLATFEKSYRPLRPGEFYSAGFMTEGQKLPYGEVRGDVEPEMVKNLQPLTTSSQFTRIGIIPPKGGAYQVGDSLMIAQRVTGYTEYGDVIIPTGLARVIEVGPKQTTAIVLNQYMRIRIGQVALPLERFTPGGSQRAVAVSDGIEAEVVQARTPNILTEQQTILFLNKGREDGVAPGDVFELWRTPQDRWDAASTVAEPLGKLQVVRVGDHTSSALVVRLISADIKPGTRAKQVAKLPN